MNPLDELVTSLVNVRRAMVGVAEMIEDNPNPQPDVAESSIAAADALDGLMEEWKRLAQRLRTRGRASAARNYN